MRIGLYSADGGVLRTVYTYVGVIPRVSWSSNSLIGKPSGSSSPPALLTPALRLSGPAVLLDRTATLVLRVPGGFHSYLLLLLRLVCANAGGCARHA